MAERKSLRPLSTRPPPRVSGFSVKQPLADREPAGAEESAEFYRSVFERSSECVFIVGLDGKFIDANDPALAMLGLGLDDLRRLSLQSLMPGDQLSDLHSSLRELIEEGSQREIHRIRVRSADGRDLVIAARASMMMKDGLPSSILCIARDVTDFIAMQDELRRSASLATAGQVAGRAGHDIRNLLSPSAALIDYLLDLDASALTPEKITTLKKIASSAREAMELVNVLIGRMMVLSAPGLRNVDEVDLNPMLVVMADQLSAKLSGRPQAFDVRLELAKDLAKMRGDRVELELAFLNIVSNAVEAMPGGGKLSLKTENAVDEGASWVKVTITDTGHGMTPDVLDHIFEPNFSTKEVRGTGLGLAITSKVVADHNGMVHVSSEPGSGTTFELFFPAI